MKEKQPLVKITVPVTVEQLEKIEKVTNINLNRSQFIREAIDARLESPSVKYKWDPELSLR